MFLDALNWTFQSLYQNFKYFSKIFKNQGLFKATSKIQGLFKAVRTMFLFMNDCHWCSYLFKQWPMKQTLSTDKSQHWYFINWKVQLSKRGYLHSVCRFIFACGLQQSQEIISMHKNDGNTSGLRLNFKLLGLKRKMHHNLQTQRSFLCLNFPFFGELTESVWARNQFQCLNHKKNTISFNLIGPQTSVFYTNLSKNL